MSQEYLNELNARFDRLERMTLIGAKDVLDIEEAALLTGMSVGHIYRLTSAREIPHYKKNRKLYFNKAELNEWMQEQKVKSVAEIDRQATTYTVTHKIR